MISARLVGVGAFVIGGVVLFAVGLFMIGERRLLFEDKVEIYAEFREVAGLQNGAKVRVAGMDAGEVVEIGVPPRPTSRFRVKLSVREDLHNLVRTDSVASIQNDGLVGNKYVQIETGTEAAPRVAADGTIRSVEPFDLADLLQQASQTVQAVEQTVTKLRGDVEVAILAVVDTAKEANVLIEDVGVEVRAIADSGRRISADTQSIIADIRNGKGSLGKFLNDDEFYERARQIARDAERAVQNVRDASDQAKAALTDLRGKSGAADGVIADFRQTLGYAREIMSDMADNAEALKRNWFFRGFFNRRGYFDLNDLTAAEYRRGALESGDRQALRIWIATPPLFEAPKGQEVLSEGGKVRLESAMSQFVGYPTTSPLVVEGYATGDTNDERFLRSRQRAELAADYIARKFRLDPQRVGTIPMGDEATDSPNGDTWDGIALTLFVTRDVLDQNGGNRAPQRPGTIAHRDN